MKRKNFLVISLSLVVILMASFIDGKKASAASAEKYTFQFASPLGVTHPINQTFLSFAKEVKDRTGGRVEFVLRPAGELPYKGTEFLDILKDKLVDGSHVIGFYVETSEPAFGVAGYPFLLLGSDQAKKIMKEIVMPFIDNILETKWNAVRLIHFLWPGQNVWISTKVINSLDEIKDLKIRAHGATWADVTKVLGATPVTITASELYSAMERKVVDGCWTAVSHAVPSKIYQICKSVVRTDTGFCYDNFAMRKDQWDRLPADFKTIIRQAADKASDQLLDLMIGSGEAKNWKVVADAGITITEVPNSEMKAMQTRLTPQLKIWAKKFGPDAESLLSEILEAK